VATLFYYEPVGGPTITPAFDAVWDQNSAALRRLLSPVSNGSLAAEVTFADAETNATNNWDVLLIQSISPPLAAQTISGTIRGQIRCSESNIAANDFGHIVVKAFSGDGGTSRGTLLDNVGATEFVLTTLTNRNFPASTAATSTDIQEGDVLVVEAGYRAANVDVASYTGTISLGRGTAIDLAVNEVDTAVANPWIEFSQDLLFMPDAFSYYNHGSRVTELVEQGTGSANTILTVTLPAVRGRRHAITHIEAKRACGATGISGTSVLYISTLNLGDMSWAVGNTIVAGGTRRDIDLRTTRNPILSDRPSTPTVFAFPAPGANVLWTVRIAYRLVP